MKRNPSNKSFSWTLENHLCRFCGGRILKKASETGMTPGGNPIFMCSDCERLTCGMSCEELCWCGFSQKAQNINPYLCLSFDLLESTPKLISAFKNCGCDPERATSKVGIVLQTEYLRIIKENPT